MEGFLVVERTITQRSEIEDHRPEGYKSFARGRLGYDHKLIEEEYAAYFESEKFWQQDESLRKKTQLETRTAHNFETAFGERFNLQISRIEYEIKNNQIFSPEYDEPFLERVRRGQKHREATGSLDIRREKAEVEGFEKVQRLLLENYDTVSSHVIALHDTVSCKKNTSEVKPAKAKNLRGHLRGGIWPKTREHLGGETSKPTKKVIVISPRGGKNSIYQLNFFDVYERVGKHVIMRRYSSKSSITEFHLAANQIDPSNSLGQNPEDADFLANPLVTYMSEEEVVQLLKLDLEVMTKTEHQNLIQALAALKLNYLNALAQGNWHLAQKIFTAALNYADVIVLGHEKTSKVFQSHDTVSCKAITCDDTVSCKKHTSEVEVAAVVNYYSALPVRQVLAGCGLQGAFITRNAAEFLSAMFPSSVSEYADTSDFPCPGCGRIIVYGSGTKECPGCGLAATCG